MSAHDHTHAHGHDHGPSTFNRAFAIGIVLNMVFVLVEGFYGWHVNSLALLADAAHNLSDVAGLVLAWGGALASTLQPDARHTYGWKRASILAAFANAVLLLVAMGSLGLEAMQRLQSPQATQGWTIMGVAAVGIVINTATALMFMRGRKGDLNVRGAFLHMAGDALVSLAVVIGGALYLWRGWAWLDPVMSLAISVIIVVGTWSLFLQSLHLLFDGVPAGIDLDAVRKALLALPGVNAVHDLHVWAMGTSHNALTAHMVLGEQGADQSALLHQAEHALEEHFGIGQVTLQLESPSYATQCPLNGQTNA